MHGPPETARAAPGGAVRGSPQNALSGRRPEHQSTKPAQAGRTDARDLHIPLTDEHRNLALELGEMIKSHLISAIEATWRGSYPLALHHFREADIAMTGVLPLAERMSDFALKDPDRRAC